MAGGLPVPISATGKVCEIVNVSVASESVAPASVVCLTFGTPADPLTAEVAGKRSVGTPLYVVQLAPVTDPEVNYVTAVPTAKEDTNKIATTQTIFFRDQASFSSAAAHSFRCTAQTPFSDGPVAI